MNFRLPTLIIAILILVMLIYAAWGEAYTAILITMFGTFFLVGAQVYFVLKSKDKEEDKTTPINLPSDKPN